MNRKGMQNIFVKRLSGLLCAWLFPFAALYAQVDTTTYHQLSGVEVLGKVRPSTTRESTPLQVMDKAGIERLGVQDLSEAVKRFSGVTVQDYGGIGGLKTVSVRSLGAKHTAVCYDGVTVTDAQSGQVDISRFSLDNVDMISLSIGQADDIFQTARMYASAGALSIKTAAPLFKEKSYNAYVKLKGGSFGLFNPVVRYEQRIGNRWSASLHADWLSAKGDYPFTLINGKEVTEEIRKNSDVQSLRLEGNVYGHFGRGGKLNGKVYYYDSERGLPGSVILYNSNARERVWDNDFFTQLHYENEWFDRLKFQANAKYNYSFSKYRDISNKYSGGKQEDLNTQNEYYGSAGILYTPCSYVSFSLNTDIARNTLVNNFVNTPTPKRWTSLTAFAAQYKSPVLTATASLLSTYITDKVENGDRPADKKRLSPAVSISWRPFQEQSFRIRASYKDIFRVPTFTDLYYLRMGNVNLKPEKATQYNIGFTWNDEISPFIRLLSVSVDGYYNKVSDKIVAIPNMYIWKMMNMGEVAISGIDANLSAEISCFDFADFLLQGNYTWQKAIDITNESAKNYRDQIPYTPRHAGSASLSIQNKWLNVSYLLSCAGDRYSLPQNIKENRIDRYIEQTISVNKEFSLRDFKLRLQGEVLNVGNINYEIIKYYPMPGRSYRILVSCYF